MFSSQTIYVFQRRQKFWTQKSLLDFRCSACALPAIMFLFALFWALELDSCIYLCETETLDTHSQKNVGSRTHAEILEISIIHLKYTCINERNRKNMSHISKYTLCSTRNWTNCRCDTCISMKSRNVIHIWNILYDHRNMTICRCDTCRSNFIHISKYSLWNLRIQTILHILNKHSNI